MKNLTTKEIFNITDFTLLDLNVSPDDLNTFYNGYKKYISKELNPASFCVYPQDLDTLKKSHDEIINPCVVINFPHADDTKEKIAEDIKKAAEYGAEIDLVFPTKIFLEESKKIKELFNKTLNEVIENAYKQTLELMEFYKSEVEKYDFKVVKMIFDTTYFSNTNGFEEYLLNKAIGITYSCLHNFDTKLFLKTSTGKVFKNEEHTKAVDCFASFIKYTKDSQNIGIKISGSVSDAETVNKYLKDLPEYLREEKLIRIGASSLLENISPLGLSKDSNY